MFSFLFFFFFETVINDITLALINKSSMTNKEKKSSYTDTKMVNHNTIKEIKPMRKYLRKLIIIKDIKLNSLFVKKKKN